jgi:MFS family permease
MTVGAALQCSAFGLDCFIVGRVVTGVGNGINTSIVPSWQSETSKAHRRGKMVMIEGALITGGICLSYWLDFGFSFLEPSTIAWRFPIGFQILFALIVLAFTMELPESPRW